VTGGGGAGRGAVARLVVIVAGTAAGALLEWAPQQPSIWRWLPLAAVYLAGGIPILRQALAELRHRRLSIDALMGMAAVGAAVVGRPLEGAILILLFSLSNLLEGFAMERTRDAIGRLVKLRPEEATLATDDGGPGAAVRVEDLRPGQRILIRPGERIAADGRVVAGRSRVDQSAITGESVPVGKGAGDEVYAATINAGGSLVVEVTRSADDTMLARIIRLVEEARESRAPAQHFIDRFAHPYTLSVVAATAAMATLPPLLLAWEWGDAFYRAMTLLVVASPCALVISTPAAILSGIANGARHGVLFKGGAYLDLAGTIDVVAFDKTGTLTEGRPELLDLVAAAELPDDGAERWRERPDRDELLRLAAAVERDSEHHLAAALLAEVKRRGIDAPVAAGFEAHPGLGVAGEVEGRRIWVGNAALGARHGAAAHPLFLGWTAEQTSLGRSVVLAGEGDRVLGAFAFGDALKANAAATVRHLKWEGIRWVAVLSGDHPDAVRAIAAELGADEVRAGLLPHEKVEVVRGLADGSRGVAMIGDGVNDAPAMAAATIGVAMGAAGTDVAIETADVVLMGDDLERVDYLIHLGKRARRVVRQNVYFSIGWMLLLVAAALTVGIPLPIAVVAHEGSTLLVAANGLRLLVGRPHPSSHGAQRARPPASSRRRPRTATWSSR
jgi:Zn2+/Cd2+-exporting ATPase